MVFCSVIMLLGVVGNIMVPIVIVKTKDMRNSTNIFLTNLSIADLLVLLVCTPTVLVEVNTRPETWILGHEMCKAVPFVELTVAHASVLTILAISFERYYAICEPLKAGYVCTKTRAILICVLAWAIAALFSSPILWVAEYKYVEYIDGSSVAVCLTQAINNWTVTFFLMTTSVFFVLPLMILIVLYGIIAKNLISNKGPMMRIRPTKPELSLKARKQVVLMLGAVVLSFFLCLLPFRVLTIWIILSSEQTFLDIGLERYYSLLYFCRIMLYLNSASNPILYNLMSTKFRKGFFKLSCNVWDAILVAVTLGRHRRLQARRRGTMLGGSGSGGVGVHTHTNATTNSNTTTTTTSSSLLSRTLNRRSSCDDVHRTRVQIQMQMPCGSDNEMMAMLHASSTYRMETYYDGTDVPVCLTMADTFWSTFYFIASIIVFFMVPLAILLLLYAAIAYKLLRRNSTLHRPTSPQSATTTPATLRARQLRQRYKIQGQQRNSTGNSSLAVNNLTGCGTTAGGMRKHRKQVIFMLVAVVSSFFICLLPFRVLILWIIFSSVENLAALGIEAYYNILYFCRIMLYLNSALNPILYNLMSSKFRTGFWRLIVSCYGGKEERVRQGLRSTTAAAAAAIGRSELNIALPGDRVRGRSGIGLLRRETTYGVNSISISSSTDRTSWRSSTVSTSAGSKMNGGDEKNMIATAIVAMTTNAVSSACPQGRTIGKQ